MRSGPTCAPTLPLFPLEEVVSEEAAGSQLLAVVTSGAVWLGHGAELLVAAEDCFSWHRNRHRHLRLPLPSASLGTVQGPPQLALLALACTRCCRAPASIFSNAIPAALQLRGQGAGICEEEEKFLHWQEVAVSLSFVHGKTSALPTVKKLWSYLF